MLGRVVLRGRLGRPENGEQDMHRLAVWRGPIEPRSVHRERADDLVEARQLDVRDRHRHADAGGGERFALHQDADGRLLEGRIEHARLDEVLDELGECGFLGGRLDVDATSLGLELLPPVHRARGRFHGGGVEVEDSYRGTTARAIGQRRDWRHPEE